jgi:hypothetical protein
MEEFFWPGEGIVPVQSCEFPLVLKTTYQKKYISYWQNNMIMLVFIGE